MRRTFLIVWATGKGGEILRRDSRVLLKYRRPIQSRWKKAMQLETQLRDRHPFNFETMPNHLNCAPEIGARARACRGLGSSYWTASGFPSPCIQLLSSFGFGFGRCIDERTASPRCEGSVPNPRKQHRYNAPRTSLQEGAGAAAARGITVATKIGH